MSEQESVTITEPQNNQLHTSEQKTRKLLSALLPALAIIILSFLTIFKGYDQPNKLFWDENYHISSAQKYLAGVYFMEPHPPLGKLLIALGEKLLDANEDDSTFISTDYGKNLPDNFDFAGYRFFPTLLAMFCPLLLYLLLRNHTSQTIATISAFILATENSFIVHSRSAMLESTQIFFALFYLICCSRLITLSDSVKNNRLRIFWLVLAGVGLSAVLCTKINGIVLVLPFFFIWLFKSQKILTLSYFSAAFVLFYLLIWNIHITLGTEIVDKLPDSGFYQASVDYKIDLQSKGENPTSFFVKLKDHLMFLPHYTKGVPDLNFCKLDENGSPWYWWPLGGKSIRYRHDSNNVLTQYLYLAVNPTGWWISFIGVLIGCSISISSLFASRSTESQASACTILSVRNLAIVRVLALSWLVYILIATASGRVLYLYHYFIPYLFGLLMLAIVLSEIKTFAGFRLSVIFRNSFVSIICCLQLYTFTFFAPLTYYLPLTEQQISQRNWLNIWNILCLNCKSTNPVAVSLSDPRVSTSPNIYVSGLPAAESFQEWGQPKMNTSVTDKPLIVSGTSYTSGLGVHAKSKLTFNNNGKFKRFKAKVAIPDYQITENKGTVVFSIYSDGQQIWKSSLIKPGMQPEVVDVSILDAGRVVLEVSDAEDGNNNDHAVWLEPVFEQ